MEGELRDLLFERMLLTLAVVKMQAVQGRGKHRSEQPSERDYELAGHEPIFAAEA